MSAMGTFEDLPFGIEASQETGRSGLDELAKPFIEYPDRPEQPLRPRASRFCGTSFELPDGQHWWALWRIERILNVARVHPDGFGIEANDEAALMAMQAAAGGLEVIFLLPCYAAIAFSRLHAESSEAVSPEVSNAIEER